MSSSRWWRNNRDEFLEAVRQSAALSPKARREALRPYATRANISGAVLRLLAGRDQRALLRALCDLAARTVLSPREIPVGAVTALVGAPFFAYVFFTKGRRAA